MLAKLSLITRSSFITRNSFISSCFAVKHQVKPLTAGLVLAMASQLLISPAVADSVKPNKQTAEAANPLVTDLPLEELRLFAEIFVQIKEAYVEEVSDTQLLESAIKGLLNGLDPHSAYLDVEDYQDLKDSTEGEFIGVGLEITKSAHYIEVVAPLDASPAAKAGIRAGDLITRIDDQSTYQLSLEEARNLLRGKNLATEQQKNKSRSKPANKAAEAKQVVLHLQRNNENFVVTLERSSIKLTSVKQELLEANLGYLRISQFQKQTAQEVKNALQKLVKTNQANLQGLVIDLRNNPGGVLDAAAQVADLFIQNGLLVYTQGRLPTSYMEFKATPQEDILAAAPLVVLINTGSASAAEIVAGALQDHKRALVVGSSSFGKGSVQSLAPLPKGKGLKLTTALYYTPNGRSIQAEGIEPDIYLAEGKLELAPVSQRTTEAKLSRSLNNKTAADNKRTDADKPIKTSTINLDDDYQLLSAVNLLKGLVIQAGN